jgi:hypothetical protein
MNMAKESNWDKYRANEAKAKSGGNYRAWSGGKGDIDRSMYTPQYKLGSQLIELAETLGTDSKEYKACEAEWRKAIKRNQ